MYMQDLGSAAELSVATRAPYVVLVLYAAVLGWLQPIIYPTKTCDLLCNVLLQKTDKKNHLIDKSYEVHVNI